MNLTARVGTWFDAASCTRGERIQSLWGGYGEAVRLQLEGASVDTVVVKHVRAPQGSGRSHTRKLRSYAVEQAFYTNHAGRSQARVAQLYFVEQQDNAWVFALEDLDAAGFPGRSRRGSVAANIAVMHWLASFHASFLHAPATGLWPVGTYWHLDTRPDEWRRMPRGPLRDAAATIDAHLSAATHQTLVHGDAKPANFCFGADQTAAVDFQYVGGGTGMKDVAYYLWGEDRRTTEQLLDVYFDALRPQIDSAAAVEAEWRALFPWAVADFQRFWEGWASGAPVPLHAQHLTKQVLALIG